MVKLRICQFAEIQIVHSGVHTLELPFMQILIADFVNPIFLFSFPTFYISNFLLHWSEYCGICQSCGEIIVALCDIQSTWAELVSCMQQLQKKAKFRGVIFDNGPVYIQQPAGKVAKVPKLQSLFVFQEMAIN